MTSQIRSNIEYSVAADNILMLLFQSNLILKYPDLLTSFHSDLIIIRKWLNFIGPPFISCKYSNWGGSPLGTVHHFPLDFEAPTGIECSDGREKIGWYYANIIRKFC